MKIVFVTALLLLGQVALAQDCDCSSQFTFVKDYYEQNSPAFQKIKNDAQEYGQYLKKVNQLTKSIAKEKSGDRCNVYFEQYVTLLKDHHSSVDINLKRLDIDIKDEAQLKRFKNSKAYQAFRKIPLDTTALMAQLCTKPLNALEGLYTNGGSLHIGIIKEKKNHYIGVVLKKTQFVDVGHVLLEFKQKEADTFESTYYLGLLGFNFQSVYNTIEIKNGKIPNYGFSKLNEPGNQKEDVKPYEFKVLDAQTNYLRLSDFDGSLKAELNAFYESIARDLSSKPYLVIDLRDNGGGDERCYFNLMPYLYTKPLTVDNVEVWVSPENIKRYEEAAGKNTTLIERMKQAQPYTFIPQVENAVNTWKLDSSTVYPRKVAVLFNRKTASSAEGLITYAMQSDKVITVGENSGGFIGYGNVMQTVTPCGNYILRCTTTKYTNNSKYEFVGIEPTHKVKSNVDWIEFTQSLFKNL